VQMKLLVHFKVVNSNALHVAYNMYILS